MGHIEAKTEWWDWSYLNTHAHVCLQMHTCAPVNPQTLPGAGEKLMHSILFCQETACPAVSLPTSSSREMEGRRREECDARVLFLLWSSLECTPSSSVQSCWPKETHPLNPYTSGERNTVHSPLHPQTGPTLQKQRCG